MEKKFANLGVTELRKPGMREEENARLKRVVADLTLDRHILQEVLRKMYGPPRDCKVLTSDEGSSHKCIRTWTPAFAQEVRRRRKAMTASVYSASL